MITKVTLLLALLTTMTLSQGMSQFEIQDKVAKYSRMQVGGISLICLAAVAVGGGAAMMASSGETHYHVEYSNGTRSESGDPVGGFGALFAISGVPMLAGGIVLTTIGTKKKVRYKKQLLSSDKLKFQLGLTRVSITYCY